jgi:hypothetical protein
MMATVTVVAVLIMVAAATAQQPEIRVGKIPFPEHKWGTQSVKFEVTNNTDMLKFLTVETDISFEDSYVNPRRIVRTNFVVPPEAVQELNPELEIPSNYGQLVLWLRIYDVVDTLDDLSLGTKVFEQPFRIKFLAPEDMVPYLQEKLTLPPLVGHYGMFDNEFTRLLPILLKEDKSIPEIAALAATDSAYVQDVVDRLATLRYLMVTDTAYVPMIPIIPTDYAAEARKLADEASKSLTELLTRQFGNRRKVIDSLVAAGSISGDSTNFYEGSTLLYRPYPFVTALCLWRELGRDFITSTMTPLMIYANTDPCRAHLGVFMYLVQGGDYYNGHQFYDARIARSGLDIRFGDQVPSVDCLPGWERKPILHENSDWKYTEDFTPESFLIDSSFTMPAVRAVTAGAGPILEKAGDDLAALSEKFNHDVLGPGEKFWFWNLVATLTTDQMVEAGTISPLNNGQYRIMEK